MANYKSYYELLKDPRWQRKRLEVMQRDGFECTWCGDKEKTLNVHHVRYRRGKKPWEYDPDDLTTLCEDCHKDQADLKDRLEEMLGPSTLGFVVGYASGLMLSCKYVDSVTIESYEEVVGFIDGSDLRVADHDALVAALHPKACLLTSDMYFTLLQAGIRRG